MSHPYLREVLDSFSLDVSEMRAIAARFCDTLERGLAGEACCLKMLPSYIGLPTGRESGVFMTIDMGGSNLRCTKFRLHDGRAEKLSETKHKLVDPQGAYNLISADADADKLFDFIADAVASQLEPGEELPLGNTFSFPCRQEGINEAYLVYWTKEIATRGVEGQNINKLLEAALRRRNVPVHPVAVLNDTVGTLLVALYQYPQADVGSIMGTGQNTCYLEYHHPITGGPMIVNIESGNYDVALPFTAYDRETDRRSNQPGVQLFEKMVAGRYIGDLVRRVLLDLCEHGALFAANPGPARAVLHGDFTALMVERVILEVAYAVELFSCSEADALAAAEAARAVLRRNARLIVSTYLGILFHQEEGEGQEIHREHVIAIDGTIFEKMPGVSAQMEEALWEVLGDAASLIQFRLVKDGSGLGAAIAAAVATHQS